MASEIDQISLRLLSDNYDDPIKITGNLSYLSTNTFYESSEITENMRRKSSENEIVWFKDLEI